MQDVFICYVSADQPLAESIAASLSDAGISSMHLMLGLGDSLLRRVEQGLREAEYGVLILSRAFFQRPWPRYDLDQLVSSEREFEGRTQLLPVWHDVTQQDIARFSPTLASKVGVLSEWGVDAIVSEIANVIRPPSIISKGYEQAKYGRPPAKSGPDLSDPKEMRDVLLSRFSDSELRQLTFDLGIDYEELAGGTKSRKVIELIGYCQRRGLSIELEQAVLRYRPNL